ncbi:MULTISPECIES: TVP38/TMEM64 family protein [unclassified Stenotrophomonas]|uniref:TVP38/TMEM64 family protein n=1 Tax=unclassified Stenotrophomonas TaxID=196198 RepID=UPI003F9A6D33
MIESVSNEVSQIVDGLRGQGLVGAVAFGLVFVLAAAALVPASPLTAIAGYLYGPIWGAFLISPAGIASAALAFLIGRHLARPWVRRRLHRSRQLSAVDKAVAGQGLRLVLLLRLALIVPFAPLSYALGASRVSSKDFLWASWLGLLPGTFLYAYLGSLASNVEQILRGRAGPPSEMQWLTWLGFGAALVAIVVVAGLARHAISKSIEEEMNDEQAV